MQGSEKKHSPWRERTGKRLGPVFIVALVWLGVCTRGRCEELFLLRARVLKVQQSPPPSGQEFQVAYGGKIAAAAGSGWAGR